MSFEVLQHTPQVAPLLVRLYDTHNLYALANDKASSNACSELTSIMVDLLNIQLSEKESELITDVLLALMKKAEADLKIAMAERLSGMDNVPLRMVLGLANDDIKIADSILKNSPVLHDMDLMYILQAHGVEHGRSIAMRKGLSGTIIDMLANTRDFQIAFNLSCNDGISLTEKAFSIFSEMATSSEMLARPLLMREDLPQEVAGKLYEFVGEELKKSLSERFGIGANAVIDVLEEISTEIVDSHTEASEKMMAAIVNQHRRGELKVAGMIASLRRGQYATFLAQLSVYSSLSVEVTKNMIRQESGKGLAIACRAMEITKADFVSIYLLTEKFRTGGKVVVNHTELSRIMTMYDEINPETARKVLKNSRH